MSSKTIPPRGHPDVRHDPLVVRDDHDRLAGVDHSLEADGVEGPAVPAW
jgi:hypothetical protein